MSFLEDLFDGFGRHGRHDGRRGHHEHHDHHDRHDDDDWDRDHRYRSPYSATPGAVQGPSGSCPSCQAVVVLTPGARFCASCGAPFPTEPTCRNCGARLAAAAAFCSGCGAKA